MDNGEQNAMQGTKLPPQEESTNVWLDPQVVAAIHSLREKLEALEAQVRMAEREMETDTATVFLVDSEEDSDEIRFVDAMQIAREAKIEPVASAYEEKVAEPFVAPAEPVMETRQEAEADAFQMQVPAEAKRQKLPYLFWFFLSLAVVVLMLWFFAWPVQVQGSAMIPELRDGDVVLMNRMNKSLQPGQLVILTAGEARRVAGVPGDHMALNEETRELLRNGEKVGRIAIDLGAEGQAQWLAAGVPDDSMYVIGGSQTEDARASGMVRQDTLQGKPWLRILPLNRLGSIK